MYIFFVLWQIAHIDFCRQKDIGAMSKTLATLCRQWNAAVRHSIRSTQYFFVSMGGKKLWFLSRVGGCWFVFRTVVRVRFFIAEERWEGEEVVFAWCDLRVPSVLYQKYFFRFQEWRKLLFLCRVGMCWLFLYCCIFLKWEEVVFVWCDSWMLSVLYSKYNFI